MRSRFFESTSRRRWSLPRDQTGRKLKCSIQVAGSFESSALQYLDLVFSANRAKVRIRVMRLIGGENKSSNGASREMHSVTMIERSNRGRYMYLFSPVDETQR